MPPFKDPCKKCLVKVCCSFECDKKRSYEFSQPDCGIFLVVAWFSLLAILAKLIE